jgi:hypothetical protein
MARAPGAPSPPKMVFLGQLRAYALKQEYVSDWRWRMGKQGFRFKSGLGMIPPSPLKGELRTKITRRGLLHASTVGLRMGFGFSATKPRAQDFSE